MIEGRSHKQTLCRVQEKVVYKTFPPQEEVIYYQKSKKKSIMQHGEKSSFRNCIYYIGVTLRVKPQKNEKLRNTLVIVHLDGYHMCIQVICSMHTCIKTKKHHQLLVCTCEYRPDKRLPRCSLIFSFFGGFSPKPPSMILKTNYS